MDSSSTSSSTRSKRTNLSHLASEQKIFAKRQLNAESARRSRQRKRNEEEYMVNAYNENEQRIAYLEDKVKQLYDELGGH